MTIERRHTYYSKGMDTSHAPTIFFNYKKTTTPLTPQNNCKNTKIKRPKMALTLGGKNYPKSYEVITLYKKFKI
jgi:hypothetical protein